MTFGRTTLNIMTFNITFKNTTVRIMVHNTVLLSVVYAECNKYAIMLNVVMLNATILIIAS